MTRALISLVNDNHVDNNLKEILMCVSYGAIAKKIDFPKTRRKVIFVMLANKRPIG